MNKIGLSQKINDAYVTLEQQFERAPSSDEIAEHLGIKTDKVIAMQSVSGKHVSLDAQVHDEDDSSLLDVLVNTNAKDTDFDVNTLSLRGEIERSLNTLLQREKEVIVYAFGLNGVTPMNLDDIAEKFKLSQERTRQIKEMALRKLRNRGNINLLKVYC